MRQKKPKPKLKWVEIHWYEHWQYRTEDGAVFGGVHKSGGAMSQPYRPLSFTWYVGANPNEGPDQLKGDCQKRSEAQRRLEELYGRYVELHAQGEVKEQTGIQV